MRAICSRTGAWASTLAMALILGLVAPLLGHAQEAPKLKIATNLGDIMVEVYPDKAPKTVANFLQYVKDKHYDGTIFHRVIGNFMVQGGGYDQRYIERRTRSPVEHEGREALAKVAHATPWAPLRWRAPMYPTRQRLNFSST